MFLGGNISAPEEMAFKNQKVINHPHFKSPKQTQIVSFWYEEFSYEQLLRRQYLTHTHIHTHICVHVYIHTYIYVYKYIYIENSTHLSHKDTSDKN